MKLKDIYFGKVDAKNEFTEESDIQEKTFEQAYLLPEYVDVNSLENGNRYIINGLKGIGKTALLRYIGIQLRKNRNYSTSFILFKSDFTAEDKKAFNAKSQTIVDESELQEVGDLRDYESIWKWFFFHYIYNCIKENVRDYFCENQTWSKFEKCIQCVEIIEKPIVKGISRFLPRIKRGQIKIEKPGFAIDLGFTLGGSNQLRFSDLVQKTEQLFMNLETKGNKRLYLLVDELEISFETKRQYERDIRIIRDLVSVTEKINGIFRRYKYPIFVIVSIRSEVLNIVNSTGKEINKCVEDFGIQIVWHQSGGSEHDHPLIQMIMKRLIAAEKIEDSTVNRELVWQRYFPDKEVQNVEVERYILYNSWFRPRDIVRLLTKGQTTFPYYDSYKHQVFDGIRKSYSSDSWTECMEELKATYNNDQIMAIATIFNGWKPYFSRIEFINRVKDLEIGDNRLLGILDNENKLLEDLYRVGIIGNRYPFRNGSNNDYKIRFAFRGDNMLLTDKGMMLHNALKPYFSL